MQAFAAYAKQREIKKQKTIDKRNNGWYITQALKKAPELMLKKR